MPDIAMTNVFRWLPEYAVGVAEIDLEHQSLFLLAERLNAATRSGTNEEVLEGILNELVEYTWYHFAHEEELMDRISYPYRLDHRRQHEELRRTLLAMKERRARGEPKIPTELAQLLVDWLKLHTTTSDRRIGSYMRKQGLVS
jgi:hemerythrin-like metal-binding protein